VVLRVSDDDRFLDELLRRRGKPPACPDEPEACHHACGDAETLAAYAEGALSGAGRERMEAHLAACRACQAAVVRLVRLAPRESAARPAAAAAPRAALFRWRWAIPALAGMVFVGSFVYYERERISGIALQRPTSNIQRPFSDGAGVPPASRAAEKAAAPQARADKEAGKEKLGEVFSPQPEKRLSATTAESGRLEEQAKSAPGQAAQSQLSQAPGGGSRQQVLGGAPSGVVAGVAPPPPPAAAASPAANFVDRAKAGAPPETAMVLREPEAPARGGVSAPQRKGEAAAAPVAPSRDAAVADSAELATHARPAAPPSKMAAEAPSPPALAEAPSAGLAGAKNLRVRRQAAAAGPLTKTLSAGTRRFALSAAGQLLAADDASEAWQPIATPQQARVIDFTIAGRNLWALLPGGRVVHSPDLGDSWQAPINTGAADAVSVFFRDADSGEVRTRSGSRLITDDGGETWK
jgi:hypothetical protein